MKPTSEQILETALAGELGQPVCILDSSKVTYLDSSKLFVGLGTGNSTSLNAEDPEESLDSFTRIASRSESFSFFTISYELGSGLNGLDGLRETEPHFWITEFEEVLVYDYAEGTLSKSGSEGSEPLTIDSNANPAINNNTLVSKISSNLSRKEYANAVEDILEEIRKGYTYQTNLTQKMVLEGNFSNIRGAFLKLRSDHPAAFAAFLERANDTVLSISPERFLKIRTKNDGERKIESSPIKGTVKRGRNEKEDAELRALLLASEKDRAENTMIVDLIRNDLGRICKYGSVEVESLCQIEEHASLFHLVSTVTGTLRKEVGLDDVIRAMFPCGSITGCPKISTMKIIEDLENTPRGLSMGALGYSGFSGDVDMSVAIRTLTVEDDRAEFNVGGGVVIDSDPVSEYEESLLKAKAIIEALGGSSELAEL